MVEFISKLIKSEAAYATENGVYFAVEKFSEYGKLSKKDVNDLQAGARVKVDEQKHTVRWILLSGKTLVMSHHGIVRGAKVDPDGILNAL